MTARTDTRLWSHDRIARLGFLLGRGWKAADIAADPLIASTQKSVYRHAHRFGLAFRDNAPVKWPEAVAAPLDAAAARRGLSRDGLLRLLVVAAASEPGLIDNILDDGVSDAPCPLSPGYDGGG